MPFSSEQRLGMPLLIGKHTLYALHDSGPHNWHSTYIIDSIELVMDSSRQRARDLCLQGQDKAQFWYSMAAVASGMKEFYWHEMEYVAAEQDDARQRYVYTWTIDDAIIKFYTKTFHSSSCKELCWYVCRFESDECEVDRGCDTDSEDVVLSE